MTIEDIAKKYKLRTKKDDCGDVVIPGRLGHLYMYDDDVVGAMFIPEKLLKGWNARRDDLVYAGAKVVQNGDFEGAVAFPAQSADVIKLAVKLLRLYRKRNVSPEAKEKRLVGLKKAQAARRRQIAASH